MSEAKRRVILSIAREDIPDFLLGRVTIDASDLPQDVEVVSVNTDWACSSILILIEHPSFAPVPPGTIPLNLHARVCRKESA